MNHNDMTRFVWEQRRPAALFLALWTAFAAMEVAKDSYMGGSVSWGSSYGRYIAQAAFIYCPWFLISLGIGWLVRCRPQYLESIKGYGTHALLAVAIGLLHLLVIVTSFWIFYPRYVLHSSVTAVFVEQALSWFHFEVLVYFAVLFTWRAIFQHQIATAKGRTSYRQKIVGKIDGEVHIASPDLVDWIEAADNYAVAHAGERSIKVRETLNSLASRLDQYQFVRVHRSAIVNLARVRHFEGPKLVMTNGNHVVCSRSGKKALRQLLSELSGRS